MANYIDTMQAYEDRKLRMDMALLAIAYYEGNPYEMNRTGMDMLRREYLAVPADEYEVDSRGERVYLGPGHEYEYNIARERIDRMVLGALPPNAKLIIKGVDDEKAEQELMRALFNFGPGFTSDEAGAVAFMRYILTTIAQVQDGLIVPRLLPEESGKPRRIRFNFYNSMEWQHEVSPDFDEEVEFYRIERKVFDGVQGNQATMSWHRLDIYRDKIIRYVPKPLSFGQHAPGWSSAPPGLENYPELYPWYFAPQVMEPVEIGTKEMIETGILRVVDKNIAVPIKYESRNMDPLRGAGELALNDFRAIDRANRMLIAWSEAVEETNFPVQVWWDAVMPKDPRTGKEISPAKFGAGAKVQVASVDSQLQGRVTYPENVPTSFAFPDVNEQTIRVAFGSIPTLGLTTEGLVNVSRLSGFAFSLLNWLQQGRIDNVRKTALEAGILEAMRTGVKILDAVGGLPAGVNADKVDFRVSYGVERLNEDERLKRVLVIESLKKLGVPEDQLVPHMPLEFDDEDEVLKGLEEKAKQEEEFVQLASEANNKLSAAAGLSKERLPGNPTGRPPVGSEGNNNA